MTYKVRNPGPDIGEAQKCGGVKPVSVITTIPLLIILHLQWQYHILSQKWMTI